MNEYKLELVARHRPEVLERILRVARHRGFYCYNNGNDTD